MAIFVITYVMSSIIAVIFYVQIYGSVFYFV